MLLFNTQYVPPGFFPRFIATLAIKESKCKVNLSQGAYHDRITLSYGEVGSQIDEIILTKCKDSMQVEVTCKQSRPPKCAPFSSACQMIAKLLKKCSDVIAICPCQQQLVFDFTCNVMITVLPL